MFSFKESNMINGIEVYTIANPALEKYRKEAKKGADAPREVIERKLTGLIINSKNEGQLLGIKHICRFGGFFMIVNESTKKIEVIGWDRDNHSVKYMSNEKIKNLKRIYNQLGLCASGNTFIDKNEYKRC